MFCEIRMMLIFVVLATVVCISSTKTVKKHPKDEASIKSTTPDITKKPHKPLSGPAIIAIEIVDPNENKTSKNSKRTIESSLGYGYQNSFEASHKSPRLEFYKYSQHDIPPFRGQQTNLATQTIKTRTPVYKTAYPKVPTKTLENYYQPGTTLYSTLNQQGQLGELSQTPQHYQDQNAPVPVILLRVMPSQLVNPTGGLYPNLPKSHPYANDLNSIDLQSLLTKYLQNILTQQPLSSGQTYQQPQYEQPQYQHEQQQYEQPQYQQQQYDHPQYQYQQEQYQQPLMYHQALYQPQYQYIHMPVLPTYENYPDDAHTRVIFHHKNGHISPKGQKVAQKTITVQLPHNYEQAFSNVEVQTHDAQYAYGTGSQNGAQTAYYYPAQNQIPDTQHYYYPQEEEYETTPYQEQHDTTKAPFNYHAHPNNQNSRRNRKARARTTPTSTKAKREKRQE